MTKTNNTREDYLRQWDRWRQLIVAGNGGSTPRDEFENVLDELEELRQENEKLRMFWDWSSITQKHYFEQECRWAEEDREMGVVLRYGKKV